MLSLWAAGLGGLAAELLEDICAHTEREALGWGAVGAGLNLEGGRRAAGGRGKEAGLG